MSEKTYEEVLKEIDVIDNPRHYQGLYGMEAIDVVRNFMTLEELRGYYKGNVLKYVLREEKKNGVEDLKKAQKHLGWLIEETEKQNDRTEI